MQFIPPIVFAVIIIVFPQLLPPTAAHVLTADTFALFVINNFISTSFLFMQKNMYVENFQANTREKVGEFRERLRVCENHYNFCKNKKYIVYKFSPNACHNILFM